MVPEFTKLIVIFSPIVKFVFSVTTDREEPSTKISWFMLFRFINTNPITIPKITPKNILKTKLEFN